MNIIKIEEDFITYLAQALNLTIDTDIYRGGIPADAEYGIGVIWGTEIKNSSFYGFRPRTWNVQILAKFDEHDKAMILLTKLNDIFPCSEFSCGETNFIAVYTSDSTELYSTMENNKEKICLSFNIVIPVLTEGAQEESTIEQ